MIEQGRRRGSSVARETLSARPGHEVDEAVGRDALHDAVAQIGDEERSAAVDHEAAENAERGLPSHRSIRGETVLARARNGVDDALGVDPSDAMSVDHVQAPAALVEGDARDRVEGGGRRRSAITGEPALAGPRDCVHDAVRPELGDAAALVDVEVPGPVDGEVTGGAELDVPGGAVDRGEVPEDPAPCGDVAPPRSADCSNHRVALVADVQRARPVEDDCGGAAEVRVRGGRGSLEGFERFDDMLEHASRCDADDLGDVLVADVERALLVDGDAAVQAPDGRGIADAHTRLGPAHDGDDLAGLGHRAPGCRRRGRTRGGSDRQHPQRGDDSPIHETPSTWRPEPTDALFAKGR